MFQNKLEVSYEGKHSYNILIEHDFNTLAEAMQEFGISNRRLCIVTESNVGPFHANAVANILQSIAKQVDVYTFQAGEESKNLDTVAGLYAFLIEHGYDRNDMLVALGGGVVGDLTGYCAATYLRGIRFVQIPTSLLAMVDSSVGGKTGVDFRAYKNMVGAFYMPKLVYINISLLQTLPSREYLSGFGEVIKYGLIRDLPMFQWLRENADVLLNLSAEPVAEMVYRSLWNKKEIVERDPKEKGERALLNFGHTLGHAIEKISHFELLHGECVALGMASAAWISWSRKLISEEDLKGIITILKTFRLPVSCNIASVEEVIRIASKDKKMDAGQIKFILLNRIGEAYIDNTVTTQEMADACGFLM